MEKLTIKELAPYLPYSIEVINDNEGSKRYLNAMDLRPFIIPYIKPILRPLSDLTKDENFDLYMDLCEELEVARCEHLLLALQDGLKYALNLQKLNVLEEFMYKNHFDWRFGLIEKGLAIDINAL